MGWGSNPAITTMQFEYRSVQSLMRSDVFRAWLDRFVLERAEEAGPVTWVDRLAPKERERLRRDLALILSEPEMIGEPLDWREIADILREYAELAGWAGALIQETATACASFRVDVRQQELRVLAKASPAVQRAANALLTGFLAQHPTDIQRLETGQIKKMANRAIWQIDLPDGYRLRYRVDEVEQVVYVVYLGPHPDGMAEGRERAVRARMRPRRQEKGS